MASKEDVVSSICKLVRKANKAGIPLEDILKCLDNERTYINKTSHDSGWSVWSCAAFSLFKLIPGLLVVLLLHLPVLQFFNGSSCIIPTPDVILGMVSPLANCSVCHGVTEAPRLVNLTRKEFAIHHAHSCRPIVVVGAASDWPAMQVFSYDYFRNLYHKYPEAINADTGAGQFFSYSSNIRNLKDLFDLSSERAAMTEETWYIGWSTSDVHIAKEIRALTSTPYFLSPFNRENALTWIFMGAPGPGASMHIDSVGEPSWQAQLSGTKTWTLAPHVECELVCTSFNITVQRGDIIVVDTNHWYHKTFVHSGDISITIGAEYH